MRLEDFGGDDLDREVWLSHYLPAWSSRELTRATWAVAGGTLRLHIPPDQRPWCEGDHEPPLRVSGLQSGSWSGPVGSTRGQQPFREGLVVQEQQERFEGWLVEGGEVGITARMTLSPRSMAALWLNGLEDDPAQERCGELCVFEVFGRALGPADDPSAEVGVGVKAFRDPRLVQDFAAPRLSLDVTDFHDYAVRWQPDGAVFSVDGEEVRRCARAPDYPLQLMLAVFDFPDWSTGDDDRLVPELVVDRIWSS